MLRNTLHSKCLSSKTEMLTKEELIEIAKIMNVEHDESEKKAVIGHNINAETGKKIIGWSRKHYNSNTFLTSEGKDILYREMLNKEES